MMSTTFGRCGVTPWACATGANTTTTQPSSNAMRRTTPLFTRSVSDDIETALHAALRPGAGQYTVIRSEVLQFPVDDIPHRAARRVFAFSLGMQRPVCRIEGGRAQRHRIRSGIDRSRDC